MSEVIYARVPTEMKQAVAVYARSRELSANAAVVELINLGLDARTLSNAVDAMRTDLDEKTAALSSATKDLAASRSREAALDRAYQTVIDRTAVVVARCPNCKGPLTAHDMLVGGRCPCGQGVTQLLKPQSTGGLNSAEVLLALAAIGVLLAVFAAA